MSKYIYFYCLIFLCITPNIVFAYTPSPTDWRDQTFYMVMLDRFEDGDSTNDNYNGNYQPSNWSGVHGGDLKGVTEHLDYIKQLGVSAIWISPVPTNDGQYHNYAAVNWQQVDPRLGTMSDLSTLIAQAHARGMYVFLDVVCNHMGFRINEPSSNWNYPTGYTLSWANSNQKYSPAPFDSLSSFHNYGDIADFSDDTQVVLGWLDGLNDIKTEDTTIRNTLVNIYEWWIQQTDCDGFRIDTFKHVDIEFWQTFCPAIRSYAASLGKNNFFMYGEIFDGNDSTVGYYTGTKAGGSYVLPSVLYYPMYFTMTNVFADNQNTSQIDDEYANLVNYDTTTWDYLATFIDNHDNPRFLSQNGNDTTGLKLALTFLLTARGVPIIYYGTEQGFYGSGDPYCREDMFAGQCKDANFSGQNSFNPNYPLFQFTSTLLYLKNNNIPLRRGTYISRWSNPTSAGIYAFSRIYNGQEIVVILNTAMSVQSTQSGGTGLVTTFPQNTILTNLLDSTDNWVVGANGVGTNQIAVTMPPRSFKILSAYASSSTPPTILSTNPSNGQTNVSLNQPISAIFSLPMNQITVQTSSFINPNTSGTFSWNAQTLIFTPSTPLLSYQVYTVTIATTAFSLNGVNLQVPYDFSFTTLNCSDTESPVISNFIPLNGSTIANNYTPTIQALLSDTVSGINSATIVMTLDNVPITPTFNASSGLLSYTPPSAISLGQHTAVISVQNNCGNVTQASTDFNIILSKVMDGNFSPGEWSTTELRVTNSADPWGSSNYIYDLYVSADTQYLYVGVVGNTDTTGSDKNVIGVYVDVPTITTGTSEVDYFEGMKPSGWDPDFMYAVVQMQNDPTGGGSVRQILSNGSTVEIGNVSSGNCGALSAAYNANGLGGIEFRIPWSATNGATEYSTIKVGAWLAWAESTIPSAGLGGGSGDQLGPQVPDSDLLTIGNPWIGIPAPVVAIDDFWKY